MSIFLQSIGPILLVGDALFPAPLLGDEAVVKILPDCSMFLKVDLDGHLAALFIGQKLNARHADPLLMGLTHNLTRRSRLVKHGVL
jgi:hypothetical protein